MKLTEQGERISFKYGLPEVARADLEAALAATVLAAFPDFAAAAPPASARETMSDLSERAQHAYHELVWEEPPFPAFFRAFTPIDELATAWPETARAEDSSTRAPLR